MAELDPNGLVQELNKRLYREREWGKKRELFPPPDAPEEGPRADPELLAVTHNIAYARMEMEALAYEGSVWEGVFLVAHVPAHQLLRAHIGARRTTGS